MSPVPLDGRLIAILLWDQLNNVFGIFPEKSTRANVSYAHILWLTTGNTLGWGLTTILKESTIPEHVKVGEIT